ncbi:MAG: hypothetical protein LC793_03395 [Thermomicrobia bacterium]|nr:hypothetical protein [Thermomicrobia bacterium]MCA1725221.1 hypothetical protein [Thermomicrobia bacterium]
MPRGKPRGTARRSNLVAAAEYRAAWWGPTRDEPSDETLARVRCYVTNDPDIERLARFTAAEVAAECNVPLRVAHFDLERLRDQGVLLRRREPIVGLGDEYVWERAHGRTGVVDLRGGRAASDAISVAEAARLLGITFAAAVTLVREGVLAIDEQASSEAVVAVRRQDVARARWWFRHKGATYAERQTPPVYVVPAQWQERLDSVSEEEAREGA